MRATMSKPPTPAPRPALTLSAGGRHRHTPPASPAPSHRAASLKDLGQLRAALKQKEAEDAARRAVSRWKFLPGRQDGQAVPVRCRVTLRFQLAD